MQLDNLLKRHPESVAFVFSEYGYGHVPVQQETVVAMVQKFGEAFAEDVASSVEDGVSNFNFSSLQVDPAKLKIATAKNRSNSKKVVTSPKRSVQSALTSANISYAKVPTAAQLTYLPESLRVPSLTVAQPSQANAVAKPKSSVWDKIKDGLMVAAGLYATAKGNTTQQQPDQPVQGSRGVLASKQGKTLLYAGIAIIVVLVGILIYSQSKK